MFLADGDVAFMFGGNWDWAVMAEFDPEGEYGIMPVPQNDAGTGIILAGSLVFATLPMIMGVTIFLAVFMVTMNLITDIVYKLIDPRINLD